MMFLLFLLPILMLAEGCTRTDDNCSLLCPFGYSKDAEGCHVCECLPEGHADEIFEGDIVVTDKLRAYVNSLVTNMRTGNGAINWASKLWKGNLVNGKYQIPYEFNSASGPAQQGVIESFRWYHANTCLEFVPRNGHADYISIYSSPGCAGSSPIGREGGRQSLKMGDCGVDVLAFHELMHALGFYHEQSRPDRDQHVLIHKECIEDWAEFNFDITNNIDSMGSPYDTSSIMHYTSDTFACCGCKALTDINGGYIAQVWAPAQSDYNQLNALYGCP